VAYGTGAVAREAARVIGADGSVTGLDLNAGMLNIARSHDPQGSVQWEEGSVQTMPFPDEAFSLLLCQQGMQYFPDRGASLREMHRVLISGGRLVLSIWRAIERSPGFLALSQALAKHISPEAGILPPFALGDATGLATEVVTAGFHDVTTQTLSRILRYTSLEEFVRTYFISTPLASLVSQIEERKRTALLADMNIALRPYIDTEKSDLAFPIESQIIMARK
jgi:ubiquinone/menaquinone biosynthesis C-methylase UbiE